MSTVRADAQRFDGFVAGNVARWGGVVAAAMALGAARGAQLNFAVDVQGRLHDLARCVDDLAVARRALLRVGVRRRRR
jgi:hypothetical protein